MTEKEQIQNQIQELQEKLKKLEEVENEKMEFKDEGRFHFFHYNGKPYQRLEYTVIPNVSWFESLSTLEYPIPVYEKVMNSELKKKLEELYQKQIVPEEPEPSMTNCVITGNPPDGYVTWQEWYNELGSKGILHNLRISSIEQKKVQKEQEVREWDVVRESVKWCEEHPGESVEDYLTPTVKQKDDYPYKKYTPEETEQSLKEAFREAVKQGVVSSTKSQTLYDLIGEFLNEIDYQYNTDTEKEYFLEKFEEWLPKEQSAEGSQNAYVESAVEGFNDCLQQIKSKLR